MGRMHNPPHPGETLKHDVLPELKLTQTQAAKQLGVSPGALARVLNGKAAITVDMAIRLGKWLGMPPEVWLREQHQYDLWQAEEKSDIAVKPVCPPPTGPAT